MATILYWGIIGAGNIAKTFARALPGSKTGKLYAVASRSREKAEALAQEFKAPHAHHSYEKLLADPEVQAVYIATIHPEHAPWAIRAAEAGKHVLCEKPLGMNFPEAMAIIEAARLNDVFLMEAFMYRCHPQTRRLIELLQEKVIGQVKLIQATFSFNAAFNAEGRVWKNASGGGGILDVGCYPVSMVRLIAGVAAGQPFADPVQVSGAGTLNAVTGVDEYAAGVLKFASGIVAQVATGIALQQENVVRIYGTEGSILIPTPWIPARDGGTTKLIVHKQSQEPREVVVETKEPLYSFEADLVAKYLDRREALSPAMSWDDTLGNMRTLDQWRQAIGLTYEAEKPERVPTVHRRALAVSPKNNMKFGRIAGIDKPVSRLIMGADNVTSAPHTAVLWDDFFERGGNCWDTAHIYVAGKAENALGSWIKSRGLRQQIIILDKGGHTPDCNPAGIRRQHQESLERLQTDYVDLYMLHRDNAEIPVGEFIDLLNEFIKAGSMKVLGASNWTLARIDEANAWAAKNGKIGFTTLSNQFSLARMVIVPWSGCMTASDPQSRAWLAKTQTPLFPWSSQARGFFLEGRAHPGKRDDAELVKCWYSEDNFRRLERANELATKKGVLPINIALAYVLCQPFPTFSLIGPRLLSETHTSLPALDVELTPTEVKWLNLED
jgi:predicted dehydrogenase/aryl-alcohol dehydrogenase-like predicted oxidoreductase